MKIGGTVNEDGRYSFWMGIHPTGLPVHQPNGFMAVLIMADPRPIFTTDLATIPPPYDEFRSAFFGYYACWGNYVINDAGDGVVHKVLGSLRPGEVGLSYARSASIVETKLLITTPPYKAGLALPHDLLGPMQLPTEEELINRLTFERIE